MGISMKSFSGLVTSIRNLGGIIFFSLGRGLEVIDFICEKSYNAFPRVSKLKKGDYVTLSYEPTSNDNIVLDVMKHVSLYSYAERRRIFDFDFSKLLMACQLQLAEERSLLVSLPSILPGATKADAFNINFFNQKARLSSSGALYLDCMSCLYGKVHSIQTVYRAEPSRSRRHLSEFLMLERAELGVDIESFMRSIERSLKEIIRKYVAFGGSYDKEMFNTFNKPFRYISYEEAELSFTTTYSQFEKNLPYSEPTYIYYMPRQLASWRALPYNTVYSLNFNLLLPGIGEVCEGCIRSVDQNTVRCKLKAAQKEKDLSWMLNYFQYKGLTVANCGIGLERLAMYIMNVKHIRSIKEFYRTKKFSEIYL